MSEMVEKVSMATVRDWHLAQAAHWRQSAGYWDARAWGQRDERGRSDDDRAVDQHRLADMHEGFAAALTAAIEATREAAAADPLAEACGLVTP